MSVRLESGGPGQAYWYAAWTDHRGKRRRKSLGSKKNLTRRAARKACHTIAADIADGWMPGQPAPPLTVWKDVFLSQRDIKKSTRREYEITLRVALEYLHDEPIDTITRQHAADLRAKLIARDGCGDFTTRKHLRNLKTMFGEAHRQGIIPYNPFDQEKTAPPTIDHQWTYIDPTTAERILGEAPDSRWRVLIALCRYAGLRKGEAIRLAWEDVDLAGRWLTVRNLGRRHTTKDRERRVPLQPRLADLLAERFHDAADGQQTVVGMSYGHIAGGGDRSGQKIYRAMLKRAGVIGLDKPFHTLRKSCETDWLAKYPVHDVCKMLGHDPSVAYKHYHQVSEGTIEHITRHGDAERIAELEAELEKLRQGLRQNSRKRG